MALLRRIKHSDLKTLANQFQRSFFQIHSYRSVGNSTSYAKFLVLNYPGSPIRKFQSQFPSNVRFFAAPVQAKQKGEETDTGPRLNEQITADVVRLVTEEGHCVLPKREALKRARNLKLDLVEVQRNAKPPVCKIMDFHREKYQQEQKEKDRAKSKSEGTLRQGSCKEIRFAGNITQKDLQIKVDTVKRLMERGYRVKCQAKGSKNKDGDGEDSTTLLSRICALIEDISVVESDTRVEDKDQAHIIVRHIKYGPLKKGSVKKGSTGKKVVASAQGGSDNDVLSEEMPDEDFEEKEQSGWKLDAANDGFNKIFQLENSADVAVNLSNGKNRYALEASSSSSGVSSHYAGPPSQLDSARAPATSSSSVVGTENRYKKDHRNSSRFRSPTGDSGYGERNNALFGPQFSGSGGRPQLNAKSSPIQRETGHGENESSLFPHMGHPEQASFRSPSSPPSNHGIFSQVDNASRKQKSFPAETNRYKQRNPSDAVGHTGRRVGATPSPRF